MIKAVIFDMDGLMIDSEPLQSQAFETILREFGKEPILHKSGIMQIPGLREKENWEEILKRHNFEEDINKLTEKRKDIYADLLKKNVKAQPGLLQLLKLLNKNKIKLAVASSSSIRNITIALEELQISHFFDAIVSGRNVPRGKPFPDTFLEAAKQLNITPKNCLVLEDAQTGIEAGENAGMYVVAIPNRFTKHNDFSKADCIVDSLQSVTMELINSL